MESETKKIDFNKFLEVDIRAGTVKKAEEFPEARKPAFKLWIDFGPEIGIKKTSAQITQHYSIDDLIGKQVMAVINFPARQIGPFMSEVLTLGYADSNGDVILASIDKPVENGARLH